MIKAGKLDRLVNILSITQPISDGISAKPILGLSGAEFTTIAAGVPAMVEDITGDEPVQEGRKRSNRTIGVTIRYTTTVIERHIVEWEAQKYQIRRLEQVGRKEGLYIEAERIGGA